MEKIVETKTCKHCSVNFDITDKDMEFYEKISPVFGGKKYLIPPPTLCPDCRQQRRLSFRNERKLYKRKCDFSGKEIVSVYSPDKQYTVYEQEKWWGDGWDGIQYQQDVDVKVSFFEQFGKLLKKVPKISLSTEQQENTLYSNYAGNNKNCYLIFLGAQNEDCYFCNGVWASRDTMDCSYATNLQESYAILNSLHVARCYFSEILENCSYCLFCYNLKGKQYHILNRPVSPEEFSAVKKSLSSIDVLRQYLQKFDAMKLKSIRRQHENLHSENVTGEYIIGSKDVKMGYDVFNIQSCKYVTWLFHSKDCYDVYDWGDPAEQCYECHKVGNNAYNVVCSSFCLGGVSYMYYCYDCVNNCSHCFGCVGLKNKQYCILNKQYTKEEYETLVPKIIEHMQQTGEWGEFFPSSMSPFGYNETVAMEYYPISPPLTPPYQGGGEEVPPLTRGRLGGTFNWSTYESPPPKVDKIIPADKLPQNIEDIPDDILTRAIECEVTKKPFRIIQQELEFYRKHQLPIPRRHPDQRHLDRMQQRNPRKLYERTCDKCHKPIQTTYALERPEIVYCQTCYEKEVY